MSDRPSRVISLARAFAWPPSLPTITSAIGSPGPKPRDRMDEPDVVFARLQVSYGQHKPRREAQCCPFLSPFLQPGDRKG